MNNRENETLRLPFDIFQRYQHVVDLVSILRVEKKVSILDVGGGDGVARKFFPQDTVCVVDRCYYRFSGFIQADACALPIKDNSFDIVVAIDIIEHIACEYRNIFLEELLRISNQHVIIAAPFQDSAVTKAEEEVNSFFQSRLKFSNDNLAEHGRHGLPSLDETILALKCKKLQVNTFPNGYLYRWKSMMIFNAVIGSALEDVGFLESFNYSYNKSFYNADKKLPAYRTIIVGSKKACGNKVSVLLSPRKSDETKSEEDLHDEFINGVVCSLKKTNEQLRTVQHYSVHLEEELKNKDTHIKAVEEYSSKLSYEIEQKNTYATQLEEKIEEFKDYIKLPFVSVVVVTFNSEEIIGKCLDALFGIDYPLEKMEVIIFDNASRDNTLHVIGDKYNSVIKLKKSKKNLGFSQGVNRALEKARGEVMILLNPDIQVERNCFRELVKEFLKDKKIGIAGCKLYYPQSTILQHAGGIIRKNGLTNHFGYGEADAGCYNALKDVDYVTGALFAIRREVIDKIGCFDPNYFLYFDETDYCMQARKQGFRVVFVPTAIGYHLESYASKKFSNFYLYHYHKSRLYFVLKNFSKKQLMSEFLPTEIYWLFHHIYRSLFVLLLLLYARTLFILPIIIRERRRSYHHG